MDEQKPEVTEDAESFIAQAVQQELEIMSAEEPKEQPVEQPTEQPAPETPAEPVSQEVTVDEVAEQPIEEPIEEPAGPACVRCCNRQVTIHKTFDGYLPCMYIKENRHIICKGSYNFNGMPLIHNLYVPDVHKDCAGFAPATDENK